MSDATDSAYRASPECAERQCKITMWHEIDRPVIVFRHGDNPEAIFESDRFTVRADPADDVRRRFRAFAERCHRRDDGLPPEEQIP